MELAKFGTKLGGKDPAAPPYRIPARDLDANFAKLRPLASDGNNRQYAIDETPDGWFLRLFPEASNNVSATVSILAEPPASGTYVLGSVNGVVQWLATEACEV